MGEGHIIGIATSESEESTWPWWILLMASAGVMSYFWVNKVDIQALLDIFANTKLQSLSPTQVDSLLDNLSARLPWMVPTGLILGMCMYVALQTIVATIYLHIFCDIDVVLSNIMECAARSKIVIILKFFITTIIIISMKHIAVPINNITPTSLGHLVGQQNPNHFSYALDLFWLAELCIFSYYLCEKHRMTFSHVPVIAVTTQLVVILPKLIF